MESRKILLRGCTAIPVDCLSEILGNSVAPLIAFCQSILGKRVTLLCGFTVELDRFFKVGQRPLSLLIKAAGPELCHGVALSCRSIVPAESFYITLSDRLADLIIPAQGELGIDIALFSGSTVPMQCSAVILR